MALAGVDAVIVQVRQPAALPRCLLLALAVDIIGCAGAVNIYCHIGPPSPASPPQDLGVVELIRRVAPGLPIHGSTQMSITSPEGAQFAQQRGVSRVVVGRELSVRDISKVSAGSSAEVEAFVHGALCVSYSGQCFSSEAWGGRSANRGQCAQACRLPYGLIVNGIIEQLGDVQYLLSPQDLAAVELVPQLIQAGVGCFKIEGGSPLPLRQPGWLPGWQLQWG
jgi:hypothetical protein